MNVAMVSDDGGGCGLLRGCGRGDKKLGSKSENTAKKKWSKREL